MTTVPRILIPHFFVEYDSSTLTFTWHSHRNIDVTPEHQYIIRNKITRNELLLTYQFTNKSSNELVYKGKYILTGVVYSMRVRCV